MSCVLLAAACSGNVVEAPADPPQSYQRLTLEITGGYGPEPCSNGKDHYELTAATRHLSWTGCDYSKTPSESIAGERTLTETEVASVNDAFHGVALSTAKNCGADAGILTLDVETEQGVKRYVDDFYSACPFDAHVGRTFVTGLGKLGSVLGELRQTP